MSRLRRRLLVLGSRIEGRELRMVLWMRVVLRREMQELWERKVAIVVSVGSAQSEVVEMGVFVQ